MTGDVEGGVRSVATALDLLDCFVADEELGVSEAARRLGVAKSTAHRLLTTLCSRGLVEQNPASGRYRLGLHLWELGHIALARVHLRQASFALLEELREASGWTVHLSVAVGADVLILERLPTLRAIKVVQEYRRRWPLHVTSSGKAICAFDPEAAQRRVDAGFPAFTPASVTSEAAFRQQLQDIRRRGYAVSHGESLDGVASVAAPVLDRQGFAVAAISITGYGTELISAEDRHGRVAMAAAHRLARMLQEPDADAMVDP